MLEVVFSSTFINNIHVMQEITEKNFKYNKY